jgi:hypothetical protein
LPLDVKPIKKATLKRKMEEHSDEKEGKYFNKRHLSDKKLARYPIVLLQSLENLPSFNQRTPSPKMRPASVKTIKSQAKGARDKKMDLKKVSKRLI